MKGCLFLIIAILLSCTSSKKWSNIITHPKSDSTPIVVNVKHDTIVDYTGPATIIYKTKNNYNNKVPVTLNDDKTKIVSYPAPQDIYYNGKLAYPTPLEGGYLLDNRGITKNVAFLNITYEEYSKLSQAPALDRMMSVIIDKDPLVEMYNCGNRYHYKDEVNDLNKIIDGKQLNKFRKLY